MEEVYENAQYFGHAPVYGLMLNEDGTMFDQGGVVLSPLAILCYTVMKSFGPVFRASRRAVADRMHLKDEETVGKLQNELRAFGLLQAINNPGRGEAQRWRILEPRTTRKKAPGATGYLTKDRHPVPSGGAPGAAGTEALKEAVKVPVQKPKTKSKWPSPQVVKVTR
jgi:hypothetical protein